MSNTDRHFELEVTGLTCAHCVASTKEELEEIPAVKHVKITLQPGDVSRVELVASEDVPEEAFRDAISEAGYELLSVSKK